MADTNTAPESEAPIARGAARACRERERAASSRCFSAWRLVSARPTPCWRPPGPRRPMASMSLVGVVETHGRSETAALLDGLEVLPRKPVAYRRRTLMEFDIEAAIARKPEAAARRRIRAHQCAGSDPPQALSGCRGSAAQRHRRLDDAQHPAPRKPAGRRPADHRHSRAGDRSRQGSREGRRDRRRRPAAGRADPAPQGGQGLSARECAPRASISSSGRAT